VRSAVAPAAAAPAAGGL